MLGEHAMTKRQIVDAVSVRLGLNRGQAQAAFELILEQICSVICRDGRIELRNFGVFEVKVRAPRKARNPRTNVPVDVPARRVVTFQPGKRLAETVADQSPVPDYH